ncbi:hypothetical protein [Rodentibacter trehalosifermentans]|uniref:hypothetical protein n=1 Tax=Rodentibacter trehalosifermentans TaxID=1908263 RepID=UPI00098618A2|nr:hypothetical protein [Rodentibacter trehalosifermentans]OOF47569.1 hypothetical protein BKK53_11170 [Rodentibacter trehalosifermentans]
MGFNLTKYNHVEKFTLRQAFERLEQEGLLINVSMQLIFEELIDYQEGKAKIPLYGQHRGAYIFDAQSYKAEMDNVCGIYQWYINPDNPCSYSTEYRFDDTDEYVIDTYFLIKKNF